GRMAVRHDHTAATTRTAVSATSTGLPVLVRSTAAAETGKARLRPAAVLDESSLVRPHRAGSAPNAARSWQDLSIHRGLRAPGRRRAVPRGPSRQVREVCAGAAPGEDAADRVRQVRRRATSAAGTREA